MTHTALLCFDFDGTLVERGSMPEFDPRLRQWLEASRGQGAAWVINTGRTLFHTLDGIVSHGLKTVPDFIVAREHEIYRRNAAGRWVDAGEWNTRCRKAAEKFHRAHRQFLTEVRRFAGADGRAEWIEQPSDPAGLIARSEEDMAEIIRFVEALAAGDPDIGWQRNSIYLRFTPGGLDKGSALGELSRQLGLGPERVFAAGDNYNDLPMLRADVAHGLCCPGNSLPEVKHQVASEGGFVAEENASRGVLQALRHYFGD